MFIVADLASLIGRQRVYRRRNERYRDNCVIESKAGAQ